MHDTRAVQGLNAPYGAPCFLTKTQTQVEDSRVLS